MDDILIRSRMNMPVTTGLPAIPSQGTQQKGAQVQTGPSFQQVLEQTAKKQELSFSKHASGRIAQREIDITESDMRRLTEGVQIARDKGMQDALIMVDGSAFIVSAKNSTVITALNSRELIGKAITNIDGTVII